MTLRAFNIARDEVIANWAEGKGHEGGGFNSQKTKNSMVGLGFLGELALKTTSFSDDQE